MSTADPGDQYPAWFRPPTGAPALASDAASPSVESTVHDERAEAQETQGLTEAATDDEFLGDEFTTEEPMPGDVRAMSDLGPSPDFPEVTPGTTSAPSAPEPAAERPEPAAERPEPVAERPEPAAERAEPMEIPEPPVTGDDSVDVALSELADVMGGSLEDQLAGYEQAHRILQDRLADVEG